LRASRGALSNDFPLLGRTLSTYGPFLRPVVQAIFLDEGVRSLSSNIDKESSMTRHIEPYRYEVQHSGDADFVAYQRKSSDGVWQTISVWMIPQPASH
jgi:hypothetical protein